MYTLDQIVREALIEEGESTDIKYAKYYQLAVSGLRELNMDISGVPTWAELPVSSTDSVNLPNDYINYTRIGLVGSDGRIHALGSNPDLAFNRRVDSCGNIVKNSVSDQRTDVGLDGLYFNGIEGLTDNIRNGEITGRLFGIGGGNNGNGYYRVDKKMGVIQLSDLGQNVRSIVLEYIGNLSLVEGDYNVHPFIVETVKSWIFWKSIQKNKTVGLGEKQTAKDDFFMNYKLARARYSSNNYNEWIEAFRTGNLGSPKF